MKTGNKIALFYSAITIGVIAVVTLVFYLVSTSYISRLYYSYLTEKAYATAQKHWEKDELDEEDYARIQQHYEETLPVAAEILLNADSMYNTPPCWCIYMTGLVLKYLENDIGGLANMQKINEAKAKVLYDYLDGQEFFTNPVEHRYRSTMNVTFTSPNADLDKKFCAEAAEAGFVNLKGHRLVGGMRASIYNAMPTEGVEKLVDFMEKFRKANA